MVKNPALVLLSHDSSLARLLGEALSEPVELWNSDSASKEHGLGVWDGSALTGKPAFAHVIILGESAVPAHWSISATTRLTCPLKLSSLCNEIRTQARSGNSEEALAEGITFSPSGRYIQRPGERIDLPQKEAELLAALLASGEEPIARDDLLERVWGYHDAASSHTLETHLYRLRQKLRKLDDAVTIKAENGYFSLLKAV